MDYARDCENERDKQEKFAEERERQIEQAAEDMLANEMDQVLLDFPHYLDEHEFKTIAKLYRTDRAGLGEFVAESLKKTALEIAELE